MKYDLQHEKDDLAAMYAKGVAWAPRHQWDAALAEIERLHRLLHDLTPGGSEFVHDPDRCAAWAKRELSTSLEAAVKAHGEANDLRRRVAELEAHNG